MKNKKHYFQTSKKKQLYYTEIKSPNKTSVVFLHGLMSDISGKKVKYFKNLCKKNKINFLAFDYSGHGKSSGTFENSGIDDWINEAKEIIKKKLNNKKLIIMGSSCGGWVGAKLIWSIKNKIKGYIGIAAAPDFTKYLMWDTFSKKAKKIIQSGNIYKLKNEYDGFYPIGKPLIGGGKKHLILNKKIKCNFPIRLFHGKKDTVVPYEYSFKLSKTLISNDCIIILQEKGDHSLSQKNDLKKIGNELVNIVKNT